MPTVTVPSWNAQGVIPPIDDSNPVSPNRSPYIVSLNDFVLRFSSSPQRCAVLDGLLRYRTALHTVGLTQGFQWLDGSYLENVEQIENRPPNDVDVVTFFRLPRGVTQGDVWQQAPDLFDHATLKQSFSVDAYCVSLDTPSEKLIERSAYWYSVWSHRRNQVWKGFVQIDLNPAQDAIAKSLLNSATNWE